MRSVIFPLKAIAYGTALLKAGLVNNCLGDMVQSPADGQQRTALMSPELRQVLGQTLDGENEESIRYRRLRLAVPVCGGDLMGNSYPSLEVYADNGKLLHGPLPLPDLSPQVANALQVELLSRLLAQYDHSIITD